jgi:hypothetical protein
MPDDFMLIGLSNCFEFVPIGCSPSIMTFLPAQKQIEIPISEHSGDSTRFVLLQSRFQAKNGLHSGGVPKDGSPTAGEKEMLKVTRAMSCAW